MVAGLLAAHMCCGAGSPYATAQVAEPSLHAVIPLGVDSLRLENSQQYLNLAASVASSELEGVRRLGEKPAGPMITLAGSPILFYPQQVSFRISALTGSSPYEDAPSSLSEPADTNDFLLHLGFRLKVFSGTRYFYIAPQAVELIGMPAEVPYDERIYRADFRLPNVPVKDRILLEVLDPQGNRISRFHFELE